MANIRQQEKKDYYQYLIKTLESWGISLYTGVTGGGVIHLLKYIEPYKNNGLDGSGFLTMGEYVAGFVPIGYHLANGRVAAAIATTGAATSLLTCGLLDAKMHDYPAVYIVPISGKKTMGFSPLQDTSVYGSNVISRLKAELPDSVFVLDEESAIEDQLSLAKVYLDNCKPVVFVLDNDVLNVSIDELPDLPAKKIHKLHDNHLDDFISNLRQSVAGKRLVILIGEEMSRYPEAKALTSELSEQLQAAVIWSINGANAVSRNNPYGYGYISFGGNDKALSLYNSLGENDVLLVIGAYPDEYTINLCKFKASCTFYMGSTYQSYGMIGNSLQHVATGKYTQVVGSLDTMVKYLVDEIKKEPFNNTPAEKAPQDLNDYPFSTASEGYADMAVLYKKLDEWWPANSIGIDDVCLSYKDRQYVVQRPNDNIDFYSLYRGSAMGGAFGVAVGAKLAKPDKPVFLFTGDGCFRLFAGSLGEVANLGLVTFILNNETLSIVEQGLHKTLPDVPVEYYHAYINSVDYCGIARASGWDAEKLNADLSNLDEILNKIEGVRERSILIEIPVDPSQILGSNPRLRNL